MESDPLFDHLRALPPIAPSPRLDRQIQAGAADILAASRRPAVGLLSRALVPTLLSGLTAGYLFWAFQAASALYP